MSSKGGRYAKVMYGSVVVAGMGEFSLSGYTPDVVEDTAFGDIVKKWLDAGIADGGTFSFKGNYDSDDSAGQVALDTVCKAGGLLTNLYFYITATKFWRVAAGGYLILTKSDGLTMAKNGLGQISFEGKVSGGKMELVGT